MDGSQFDGLTRALGAPVAPGTRRGLLRLLAALPFTATLAVLLAPGEPAEADGSGAFVGGSGGRRNRRQVRHHHHPGKDKENRNGKRKGKTTHACAFCRSGESCLNGACSCGGGPGCTGVGEICQSGICHNPYGCTAAMDFCQTDPQMPSFTPCPGNPNGVCLTAAEGSFCVRIGNEQVDPNVSKCAPGNDCANCPAGSACVTVLGGVCTCPGGGTKVCAVPPPPP